MGLKGYRLWVMGQLDSTCRAPPRHAVLVVSPRVALRRALQCFHAALYPVHRLAYPAALLARYPRGGGGGGGDRGGGSSGSGGGGGGGEGWLRRLPLPHLASHVVAVQVEFDRANLEKTGNHISGSGVATRRFQAMGQLLNSTCTASPCPRARRSGTS
jgi:hypothetical protein